MIDLLKWLRPAPVTAVERVETLVSPDLVDVYQAEYQIFWWHDRANWAGKAFLTCAEAFAAIGDDRLAEVQKIKAVRIGGVYYRLGAELKMYAEPKPKVAKGKRRTVSNDPDNKPGGTA